MAMRTRSVEEVLGAFDRDCHTVNLCDALFKVVPGGPAFVFYNTLEGAVARIAAGDATVLKAASELAATDDARKAVWVADKLDTVDAGIGIYTSVKNLLSLVRGRKGNARTFEADPQQATDAALKAAGVAYMVHKLFPGSVAEKVDLFWDTPAGQELATYYAAAEIALPFTDNMVEAGTNLLSGLFASKRSDVAAKFAAVGEDDALNQASGVLDQLTKPLGEYVDRAKGQIATISEQIKAHLPSASKLGNLADSATGALATGVDLMPVWRFLGSRLVAEACVLRAKKGM